MLFPRRVDGPLGVRWLQRFDSSDGGCLLDHYRTFMSDRNGFDVISRMDGALVHLSLWKTLRGGGECESLVASWKQPRIDVAFIYRLDEFTVIVNCINGRPGERYILSGHSFGA